LGGFTVVLVVAMRRGEGGSCGCFGARSERAISWVDVARNVVVMGLAVAGIYGCAATAGVDVVVAGGPVWWLSVGAGVGCAAVVVASGEVFEALTAPLPQPQHTRAPRLRVLAGEGRGSFGGEHGTAARSGDSG
jgi:hypothetical protein